MPGDETACYLHNVLALFWGYCRLLLSNFAFYVQCLAVAGVSQSSSNVAGKIEFHKGLKDIRYCLGSPGKCVEVHHIWWRAWPNQVEILPAFLSRVFQLANSLVSTFAK